MFEKVKYFFNNIYFYIFIILLSLTCFIIYIDNCTYNIELKEVLELNKVLYENLKKNKIDFKELDILNNYNNYLTNSVVVITNYLNDLNFIQESLKKITEETQRSINSF